MTAEEFAERERAALKALETPDEFGDWLRHKECCAPVGFPWGHWAGPLSRFVEDTQGIRAGFNRASNVVFATGALIRGGDYRCGHHRRIPLWCSNLINALNSRSVDRNEEITAGEAWALAVQAARE